MLKTYRVKVKMIHYETYEVDAHSQGEALISYDEGQLCSATEPETEKCTVERVKS